MLEDFLALHPLGRSWLDEIVDLAVSREGGEVSVADLVQALAAPGGRSAAERTAFTHSPGRAVPADPRASRRAGWRRPGAP